MKAYFSPKHTQARTTLLYRTATPACVGMATTDTERVRDVPSGALGILSKSVVDR